MYHFIFFSINFQSTSPFTVMGTRHIFANGSRLVKFFSKNAELKPEVISLLFILPRKEISLIFSNVYEKHIQRWFAYPYVPPLSDQLPPLELSPGLYYPSAFESGALIKCSTQNVVATTMECSIISSHNVVRILLQQQNVSPHPKMSQGEISLEKEL